MAASPGARYGAIPDATRRQPRDAAASAVSRRSRASSRPRSSRLVHTGVAVSTWNRISSCCTPGSPPSICARSGPAGTAVPAAGSRSTNSSSTPSVIPPAARAVPGGSPGTVTSGPVPSGPGVAGHPAGLTAAGLMLASYAGSAGVWRRGPSWPFLLAPAGATRPGPPFANYSLQSAWFNNHPATGPGSGPYVPTSGGRSAGRVQASGPYPVTGPSAGAWAEGQQLGVPSRSPLAC